MTVQGSLEALTRARRLAEAGQYSALVDYLEQYPREQLEQSPTLALLYGTGQGRLGRYDISREWVERALGRASELADAWIEARALNTLGAIALESGSIDKAEEHFNNGHAAASELDDLATMGRCLNNLGIIANLRGDHMQAISSFTRALAAFQQAGLDRGVSEAQHNLAISHRDKREFEQALDAADRAVQTAQLVGDRSLLAQTWAGRAEVRVRSGDGALGRREVETALVIHRELSDPVGEAEDLRILGLTLAETGDWPSAEETLRGVLEKAEELHRPLLAATTGRDLADFLWELRRRDEAKDAAHRARALFDRLGATAEVRKLDELIEAC